MNRNVGIATAIGIAIVIGVIGFQINDTMHHVSTPEEYKKSVGTQSVAHVVYPDNPQLLGPLQINKDKYLLGENVYVILKDIKPGDKTAKIIISSKDNKSDTFEVTVRIDTPKEWEYFQHGGILQYVIRGLVST